MKILVLSEHDVHELLTMRECIEVMEDALRALARGEVFNPLRMKVMAPGAPGLLGMMASWRGGATPYYGLKEVCVFPGNPKRGLDTHVGAVILHSGETGQPLAFVNASAITEIRTAAVSAVATRLLARDEPSVLAILGTGVQAKAHREAIPLVRNVTEVRMCGRNDSAEDAVRGADIIVTATSSKEPVLRRGWLKPGAHINAVGSSIPAARELDGETFAATSLFVDRRESTINESGDFLFAAREGFVDQTHIRAEIGELLEGTAPGRTSNDEITLFKSLGLAIEDLASAAFLYDKARAEGRGSWVEF
ncbi:MAG TPA: ornithine cyclodeaminase family protein [Thermoanaerobaculia bacterium]|nr:ornithine cyclodeaminase family protein [Thermoanaerobaculia bacterium]